ncbi:MAG: lytic transglycosylase domain-containing protein, partial [Nitrospira sp.]|nr:lytic transglycosylase domain-containing protein [Nitrospira sp.]
HAESRFNPRAISSAGALGLAQVMPKTARMFVPDLTDEELFDAELNLRIGFRFLHQMLQKYSGDLSLALLAYNRGPARLQQLLASGLDPRNGYASLVLEGYLPDDGDQLQ